MLKCSKYKPLIDLYWDGEADDHQKEMIISHIRDCEGCRAGFEETKRLHRAIKSVPVVKLPEGFRSAVIGRLQERHRSAGFFPAIGWIGAAAAILILAVVWYIHNPEPVLANPEIHIVSPREDAVVEHQYVDVSAAFSNRVFKNVRVILDGRDVTESTNLKEDFFIYTSGALQGGYHIATIQVVDNKGVPAFERSWSFYVIPPEEI